MPLMAQKIYNGQINIASASIQRQTDSLYVHMMIDISGLQLGRNLSLTLTPMLVNEFNMVALPDILINGTLRDKVYQRSQALGGEKYTNTNSYAVVKLDKKSSAQLHYIQAVAYRKWMDGADLDINQVLCGCAGNDEVMIVDRLLAYTPQPEIPYIVDLQMAYIQPQAETVKARCEQREVYLNFPVNQTNILPDFMNNAKELAVVEDMLKAVKANSNLTVKSIDIIGFASPEGYVGNNDKLAKGRADVFKKYLASKLYFPQDIYNTKSGGENWSGLLTALETSNMKDKDLIIDIIKNTSDLATRKTKLKELDGGIPYRHMLYDIYPKLRKVVAAAHFTVCGFNVEEAKVILKSSPQQLSLIEMFNIANTYKQGDNDFTEVFESAVRLFPDDETANLNAAATALSSQNLEKAKKYLEKANKTTPEYANNLGVLYFLLGDPEQARLQFQKAATGGIEAAKHNLQEMNKKK